MPQLITYSKFYTAEEAKPLLELLKKESIPFEFEQQVNQIDKIYIGESFDPMFEVRIPQDRFEYVNALIDSELKSLAESPDPQHYLYTFSDDELMDVLRNPDEWNSYDQELANKILSDRGVEFKISDLHSADDIYQSERMKMAWIVLGYILSITIFGLFIGLTIIRSKKTLKNGRQVMMYDEYSRGHGNTIFIVAVISTIIFFIRVINSVT